MSGGSLDYFYSRFDEPLDYLREKIRFGKKAYSDETIKLFQEAYNHLKESQVYAKRLEWLFSGDDGEDSFKERLEEELKELKNQKQIIPIKKQCKYCCHFNEKVKNCEFNLPTYRYFVYSKEEINRRYTFIKNKDASECEEFKAWRE